MKKLNIIVTGGLGFIGSSVIRKLIRETEHRIVNIDCLTYAANPEAVADVEDSSRYRWENVSICDRPRLDEIFTEFKPNLIMNLAAESHVDKSISSSQAFIETNILGTFQLLEASRCYLQHSDHKTRERFRFHHISTDEVYGDLGKFTSESKRERFVESSQYKPSSPYAATKASSDHLVRAWGRTYNLPVVVSNCSNNYGPFQDAEKLIPKTVIRALNGQNIPVYGDGTQVRDWLFVEDHADALIRIALDGVVGESYNVGGNNEKTNLEVIHEICECLDLIFPSRRPHFELVEFVADRPGHDQRYSVDASKIAMELGWRPIETFENGISKTVDWYLENYMTTQISGSSGRNNFR